MTHLIKKKIQSEIYVIFIWIESICYTQDLLEIYWVCWKNDSDVFTKTKKN